MAQDPWSTPVPVEGSALTVSEPLDESSVSPVTIALLGASNLSRGYWALSHCLRDNLRQHRVRVLAALGPGRGYVAPGGLGPLIFPPIKDSQIFQTLKRNNQEGERTVAFLTDLGNDFLFNVTGEELIHVLDDTFSRLEESRTQVLVTPIHPVLMEVLTPNIYKILRAWLYPKSRVSFQQVISGIGSVNDFLMAAEAAGRIRRVVGLDAFLGWDFVHYGWVQADKAWNCAVDAMLSSVGETRRVSITRDQMFTSYFENGVRLVGTDMLGCYPRRSCLF